jgi:hypothetical protein
VPTYVASEGHRNAYTRAASAEASNAAYGFRLTGLAPSQLLALPNPAEWPELTFEQVVSDEVRTGGPSGLRGRSRLLYVRDGQATMDAKDGRLILDRRTMAATILVGRISSTDHLLHPYVTMAATVFARWNARETFHAGAFLANGRAWALAGECRAGKSTLLGFLALNGHPIVTDDLLVLDRARCLAGPRCVDLRPSAAARIGVVEQTTPARGQARRRLPLPSNVAEAELGGWIYLRWGDALRLRTVPPAERLRRLSEFRSVPGIASDPRALLALAALPAWELSRPRRADLLPRACEQVLAAVAD